MVSVAPPGPWPDQPVIEEINTWVWLAERSRVHGRRIDLGSVPNADWDAALLPGVDAVWLMGVWTRSPAGSVIARTDPHVRAELEAALPDLTDDDVVGSPYAVRAYSVDARLGGNAGLAAARSALAERGVRLLVDYVPNHVARDHAWVTTRPEYLVQASEDERRRAPDDFIVVGGHTVALGRDPYFPPWTDVVQLNAFSQDLRDATGSTLRELAGMADGVRCDMAMLLVNDVFARTWGHLAGDPPDTEFWGPIIAGVKRETPDFLLVAEAYWDLEAQLLGEGFDYCYDKRLYDRLITADATGLRAHLRGDLTVQRRMVRFLENHDERRSATVFAPDARRTAAVAVATLPGAVLLYEGQAEGRTTRPPVQLARRRAEEPDTRLRAFYERLLSVLDAAHVRTGDWHLLEVEAIAGAPGAEGLVAWSWQTRDGRFVVVVNLAGDRSDGRIRLPWGDVGARVTVAELLDDATYDHDGDDVAARGLFVSLPAHGFHVLRLV